MANILINIPDEILPRVVDAVATTYGWGSGSKLQFTKQQIAVWLKEIVKAHEANQAGETARKTAAQNVDSQIEIE